MNGYEYKGRRVLIEFTCGRCGKTHIEPYSQQAKSAEGNIQCFHPPKGWLDIFNLPTLCDECAEALMIFLRKQ